MKAAMDEISSQERTNLKGCIFPDKTELQERILKTHGDVIIGEHSRIDYGIFGYDVFIADSCYLKGDVTAEGDLRVGNFCEIDGSLIADADAYIGEGVTIRGKLSVMGNLDIGDNVIIENGFDARGTIEIRNPVPVIMYIILYVMMMLRIDREDEIDQLFEDLCSEDEHPLILPSHSHLDGSELRVRVPLIIGSACRLHGLFRGPQVSIGSNTTLFGSIRASDLVSLSPGVMIHGNVEAKNEIIIEEHVHVLGNVQGRLVTMDEDATVEGVIRSAGGLTIRRKKK
ncbi:acyltransferase [Methanocalculus sp. MSAO_Arc2]|uniref:acyltransferase n=1 Tax=Methanocalculus sp. MSAO_Arc2 TaxID=2293855 RepID=UPI0032176A87